MEIAGYEFTGPFTDVSKVPLDRRGVYVVVCLADGEVDCYLDVGESEQVGERLKTHNRKDCWEENAHGEIAYCYRLTSGTWDRELDVNPLQRVRSHSRSEQFGIEGELKWKLDVACGPNPWEEIEEYWEIYREYEAEFGPRAGADAE
ncbi:hypothetical protein AArcSl_1962 [Halalkaliarchaeum desulfuricum]|uniref:GIY-YIG domain-containing protein n=1 Tax=Halalkaliarchaeum desulfuricum TaxID=2055893 RepID=A0A343TKG5_9EURY|nr:hypothetical protein [Halalkaliarchaeum desulfuricum]AUX09587.1 hypothetical protein AArcSl_1962 [Halalkaliarchaeum desulfuricum]